MLVVYCMLLAVFLSNLVCYVVCLLFVYFMVCNAREYVQNHDCQVLITSLHDSNTYNTYRQTMSKCDFLAQKWRVDGSDMSKCALVFETNTPQENKHISPSPKGDPKRGIQKKVTLKSLNIDLKVTFKCLSCWIPLWGTGEHVGR